MKATEQLLSELEKRRDALQIELDDVDEAIAVLTKLHGPSDNKSRAKKILRAGKVINSDVQGSILNALKNGHPQITPRIVAELGLSASPSAAGLALMSLRRKKLVRKLSRGLYTLREGT